MIIIGIIILVIAFLYIILSVTVFKEYNEVEANYETLIKVLETRDLLLMRVLPEIKSNKTKEQITNLVSNRLNAKKISADELILRDVELNKKLKVVYDELNESKNPIVREEFRKIVHLEKNLKQIRRNYNEAVEKYNAKFSKNPKLYLKRLHMKPLNTYDFK
jgi:hypothetical protein